MTTLIRMRLASGLALATTLLALALPSVATPAALGHRQPQRASAPAVTLAQTRPTSSVDLSYLKSYLDAKQWQAADHETRRILQEFVHPNGDIFAAPQPANIPVDLLRTLDRLWLAASGGRFGFSVQQRLWREASAQYPGDTEAAVRAFGRRVGWLRPIPDRDNFTAPEWFTELELINSLDAPVGYFPWAGVDWERIETLLAAQSCGSCTVDALYLQGDRFYRYLPSLYAHVTPICWVSRQFQWPISVYPWRNAADLIPSGDINTAPPNPAL